MFVVGLLWTAPEHLPLDNSDADCTGSTKGDIYSLGIILQEIALRSVPFSSSDLPAEGLVFYRERESSLRGTALLLLLYG